ncbi:30S ribosomal protein S4 [Candidatus Saganbacteria bacterium CG08_land_8_20_14_0_20_45_16]|uniref:Small ribosomal subunit protein uS4 n=1 Tax=Candidatus Saganbacteria bacterium CG08_land_8_20_14_0_20_45_16 TaxID=2014293 RepID=A0A2H0XZM6_UNCSA|nr:MAG: 30S ribosomal protein S4 [Candidatus Saganbacteria bacterium CG08_land_8_20_14_0_20_45_16]
MGRHTQASCKLCRREKEKLFLKGEKCYSAKCPVAKRSYPPGQHGRLSLRISEYGIRLREKQKARRIYGLTERQFERYFNEAAKSRGATGAMLLEALERRLDNVVFRLGFAASRQAARQMVHHQGVTVDGKVVNIPSFSVKVGSFIKIRPKYLLVVKAVQEKFKDRLPPVWLSLSGEEEGSVVSLPKRSDIDTMLEDHFIVEYYSR